MRLILTLALLTYFASNAHAQAPDSTAHAPLRAVPTRLTLDAVSSDPAGRLLERDDSSRATHHRKHALFGAAVGAGVGIAAGVVSLGHVDLSCDNGVCTRQRNGIVVVTLFLDSVIGAAVGTLVGALVP